METKYKILIVEDDPLIRLIYTERLEMDDYIDVETAEDGLDGLNKIKANNYDLIFSGIQMPNKTGFELFQDLQSDTNLAKIPFIIFSHLGRIEDIQRVRDLGIEHFIIRGETTPNEISEKIKDILYKSDNTKNTPINRRKILIVEDNAAIRSIYVDRFGQDPSLLIEEAEDGLDGLNKIKANNYDLIFSGIQMPNKTGFDLFQEVNQLPDKKDIPILLFSHLGRTQDIERARQIGVKYFIVRGSNTPNEILSQILDILNAKDKIFRLSLRKDSPDYAKFLESFLSKECAKYEYDDSTPVKVTLSKAVKPYTFFIELDCEDK